MTMQHRPGFGLGRGSGRRLGVGLRRGKAPGGVPTPLGLPQGFPGIGGGLVTHATRAALQGIAHSPAKLGPPVAGPVAQAITSTSGARRIGANPFRRG